MGKRQPTLPGKARAAAIKTLDSHPTVLTSTLFDTPLDLGDGT
jgi:hypothetical protein